MRRLAFLVCACVFLSPWAAAQRGSATQARPSLLPSHFAGPVPAIALAGRYATPAAEEASYDPAEWPAEEGLSDAWLALAMWLPIAAAVLALAMEGSSDIRPQETRSRLWVE